MAYTKYHVDWHDKPLTDTPIDAAGMEHIESGISAVAVLIDDHLADTADAHDASAISYLGSSNISATDVEAALDELDSEKQAVSQKNQANGYAGLDGSTKLSSSVLPDIAISEYLGTVANQSAMLALTGQRGDWCIRSDLGTTWVLSAEPSSTLGNWVQLSYPTAPVTSVAGKTGAVTLAKADVGLGNVDNTSNATERAASATLQNKTLDNTNTVELKDTLFTLQDDGDSSKKVRLNVSNVTGTVTFNMPAAPDGSTLVSRSSTDILQGKSLTDDNCFWIDNSDNTKKLALQLSGLTTATTRTWTVPDVTGTVLLEETFADGNLDFIGGEAYDLLASDFTRATSSGAGGVTATALAITLPANATYEVDLFLSQLATGDGVDLVTKLIGPTGASGIWSMLGPDEPITGGTVGFGQFNCQSGFTTSQSIAIGSTTTRMCARIKAIIEVGGTGGALTLHAGRMQNTGTITIHQRSFMKVKRIG